MVGMIQPQGSRARSARRGALAPGHARWWIALLVLVVLGALAVGLTGGVGWSGPAPVGATAMPTDQHWIDPWTLAPDAAGRPDLALAPSELARRLADQQPRYAAPDGAQLPDR
jgi:hypothetical protein